MTIIENMMFSRPFACRFCPHGYYGMLYAINYAQEKGYWNIIDMSSTLANKDPIYSEISEKDPFSFYGFGHGNNCVFTGDAEEPIFTCDECGILAERIVYLHSCLTANGLGPAIIESGGLAYAGFNISWTWISEGPPVGDPYNNKYARGFFESANELWMSLIDHKTIQESADDSVAKYNEWIEYWRDGPGSSDPNAANVLKWLAYDRDGLVVLGHLDAKLPLPYICEEFTTKDECLAHNCWWYNNTCNSQKPPNTLETKTFTISLLPGLALIERLRYPAKAYEEQQITIEYYVKNMAEVDTLWGQIVDDTGNVVEGSYWEEVVTTIIHITTIFGPITKDITLKVQVGHMEE